MKSKAFFLDRDGVINKNPKSHDYVKSWAEVELLPTVAEALKLIRDSGYLAVVVTNQRGVARGLFSEADLLEIHTRLNLALNRRGALIDAFYYCIHDYEDRCDCRKPLPGLIHRAVADLGLDLSRSHLIGDSQTDIATALAAGIPSYHLLPADSDLLPLVQSILAP